MIVRVLRAAAMTGCLVVAACRSSATNAPAITLIAPPDGVAYVEVTGVSAATLAANADQWARTLRVAVNDGAPAMLGTYSVSGGALRFTPAYPFDPGRQYHVRYEPSGTAPLVATVGLPARHTTPTTVVTRVYPSGDVVPENLLRMYIEFSAPMGRPSGIPHMKLLDEHGLEIPAAFLPLDYEFWSPDHKRFTAFLDPGRVKGGILPNQQMGRALKAGHPVTLTIGSAWRDENGQPLREEFTRVLRVGAADAQPLDPRSWRIEPPEPGGRDSLVVRFPKALDHGLLMRALGVKRDDAPVDGEIAVSDSETTWTFTPRQPWRAGGYQLIALEILEDVAGNQIGRAFEVDNFDTVDQSPNPKSVIIPFSIPEAPARTTR
jgi:hypothetical protein